MSAWFLRVLAAAVWLSCQRVEAINYTVHSSFVFARTGEYTPLLTGNLETTSYGAKQMYNLGSFFRERYITGSVNTSAGDSSAAIVGLSSSEVNNTQIMVMTPDSMATVISAQALMQGFYPPSTLVGNGSTQHMDPNSILANGTYLENPLNGYQYPLIQSFSTNDPNLVYLDGENNCVNYDFEVDNYYGGALFDEMANITAGLYQLVGQEILTDVLPVEDWGFGRAYTIYDYVRYQDVHNVTVNALLSSEGWTDVLPTLYMLASEKEYSLHANLSVSGITKGDKILSIAGQTLAAEVLGALALNIASNGSTNLFNLVVSDYQPMLALFALMQLSDYDTSFRTLPSFGSAMVFELFSWGSGTAANGDGSGAYPPQDELFVQFYYRNSTGDGSTDTTNGVQSYPLFNYGPSNSVMPWTDFESMMNGIMLADVGSWCLACGSPAIWCPAFFDANAASSKASHLSPQVAGVIGAAVTVGALALLVAAAMLLCGLRVHRNKPRSKRQSTLGGFKGSRKLASDADLSIPKNAAPITVAAVDGTTATEEPKKGHERVGSWEMKSPGGTAGFAADDKPFDEARFSSLAGSTVAARSSTGSNGVRRASFEDDEETHEAEVDRIGFQSPVVPNERV